MGIRPWEIDRLTYAEFEQACAAIDAYQKANSPKDGDA